MPFDFMFQIHLRMFLVKFLMMLLRLIDMKKIESYAQINKGHMRKAGEYSSQNVSTYHNKDEENSHKNNKQNNKHAT